MTGVAGGDGEYQPAGRRQPGAPQAPRPSPRPDARPGPRRNSRPKTGATACHLLLRAGLVPARAGADSQVIVHVPIGQLRQKPGAADLEDAWLQAKLGEHGEPGTAHLTGNDAEAAGGLITMATTSGIR